MKHLLEEIESIRTEKKADDSICEQLLSHVYALIPTDTESALQAAREIRDYALEHNLSLSASMAMLAEGLCYHRMDEEESAHAVFAEADFLREDIPQRQHGRIGRILLDFGKLCLNLGALHPALTYLRISLTYCLAENEKEGIVEALNFIGIAYAKVADYEQALTFFFRCLEFAEEVKGEVFRANVYCNIGNAYQNMSEFAKALEYIEQAQAKAEYLGNNELISICLNNKGIIYGQMGEYANALECFLSSFSARESDTPFGKRMRANTLNNIGNIYQKLGEFGKALEYHKRSLTICRDIGDRVSESSSLHNIGCIHHEMGEYEEANEFFLQGLAIREQIGDIQGVALSLDGIGSIHALLGRFDLAKEVYLQSLAIADEIGDKSSKGCFLHNLGHVCLLLREPDEAIEYFQQGLEIAQEISANDLICKLHEAFFKAYRMKGNLEAALEQYMLFHHIEKQVFNEESSRRIATLQTFHLAEQARKEAEIYRLKNVELAAALASLEEANRQLNELNEEKNELLGIAAHDLKNPLQSIKMIAEILRNDQSLERKEVEGFSGDILSSSRRMFELITNLLDINAIENQAYRLQIHSCNIIELVRWATRYHQTNAEAKNIRLIERYESAMLMVQADENALHQIIDNLISNAVKFSPHNSTIYISVRQNKDSISTMSPTVLVEVQDEGPGLTDEDKQKLFGKFARLSARPTAGEHSTGLGLSIVKKLAEAMSGSIRCESEFSHGATFILEIPAVSQKAESDASE